MDHNFSESLITRKEAVVSSKGIVASQHKLASRAGAKVLAEGGNAVDAAVATAFTVSVLEPWMSGIGGGGHMLIHDAPSGKVHAIDFGMRSPIGLDPEDYPLSREGVASDLFPWPRVVEDHNIVGATSIAVPGQVDGMRVALENFGSRSWKESLQPAIQAAEAGMQIDWYATLLIGSAVVTYFAFTKLGGWGALHDTVGPHMISVLRPSGDFSGMPWHAVVLGYPVIGIWYWCTDQTIVQRVLGAKNEDHGKAGALFACFLKLLPMFLFVLPGLLCLALVNNGLLPELADTKEAFAHMVMNLLPAGMKGLIVAALLAALMGTIAGALNSIATLFAFDLYKRFKPDTSDKKLVHIGRAATITGVILAIIWSPIIGRFDSIYGAIASMICSTTHSVAWR